MATLENNGGNISVMNIKEVYTNVLLISIANNRNFGRLVKEAEKETKGYLAEMNGRPSVLPGGLPEGFSGIFFIESLARKTGSSLGEAYLLTPERKEDIILHLLQSIEPIEETYSDYYDDENYSKDPSQAIYDATQEQYIYDNYGSSASMDYLNRADSGSYSGGSDFDRNY